MNQKTKRLTAVAMLCALAFVASFCKIPVVLWLKYEPKDVIIAMGGFIFGPATGALIALLAALLEMTVSETGVIGMVMNFLASCAFVVPAAALYKKRRSLRWAAFGLIAGALIATVTMLLWNYFMIPLYTPTFSRADVAELLVPVLLPFNLLKTGLNTALVLFFYKPAVRALRRAHLMPPEVSAHAPSKSERLGAYLLAFLLLLTCVFAILTLRGIL